MKRLTYRLCMVLFSILAGTGTGVVLIPIAYADRGCFAVGSEWILIIGSAVLTAYAINKFYKWRVQRMPKSYKETLHFKDTVVYFQEEEDKQETLTLCDLLGECE